MPRQIGRIVSKKVSQTLLQDRQWLVNVELSTQNMPVYRHADGRILIVFDDGKGRLIEANESRAYIDMVEARKTTMRENPHGRHMLVDRLPQGADFVAQVPALIAELPTLLNLSAEDLDFSSASLVKIDGKLKKQGRVKCTNPPLFPALVAYVGEMYNRKIGSTWSIRHNTMDVRVWEPLLILRNERVCDLAGNLFDGLNERSLSLSKLIGGPWISWRIPPRGFWEQADQKNS